MEPPAKRQKISQAESFPAPSRTIDLDQFQRNLYKRVRPGRVVLPRAPDVTVTAAVLEVAVNEGSVAVVVTSPATGSVEVTLSSLGTLTVPAIVATPSTESSARTTTTTTTTTPRLSSSASESSSFSTTSRPANSTISSSDRTITVTSTNTFHVSYTNGTFITPSQTHKTRPTGSSPDEEDPSTSDSDSTAYVFGQGFTETTVSLSGTTATHYSGGASSNPTLSSLHPSNTGDSSDTPSGPVLTPQQTQMVGGIVGGVAGVAFVIVVILYVLRWYRQRMKVQGRLPEKFGSHHDADYGDKALASLAAPMSQTRSNFFAPVALKKFRPRSDLTVNTVSTAADSEKGFRRVSGRKIPSVLSTGGDQYGGSYGIFEKELGSPLTKSKTLGSSSFQTQYTSEKSLYTETTAYAGSTPSRVNLIDPTPHSAPASPLSPPASTATFINHSRPRPHPARRPSVPYSNPASGLASPTTTSPYVRHTHNDSQTSTDSQFDPAAFDSAFQRNIAMMRNIAKPHPKPDGYAVSRNSPARTPVIQSPGAGTLRLPMGVIAGYSMDDDVPEMPLPSPGLNLGMGVRVPSGLSAVSSGRDSNVSGRFKEDL